MDFTYSSAKKGNCTVIMLGGALDAKNAPAFDKKLNEELLKKPSVVVISLKHVDYIASAGMGVLINCNEKLSREKKDLRLCELSPKVEKIITMLGFTNFFAIYPSIEDAQKA